MSETINKYLGEEGLRKLIDLTKAYDAASLTLSQEYINEEIAKIKSGDVVVKEANHATAADSATNATHAVSADTATEANHAISADSATNATNAQHAVSANSATEASHAVAADSATKAIRDGSDNVITETYETKEDASTKLDTAKQYADTQIAALVNSAPETLDTLGELATAINENQSVIDALDAAITNKADKEHTHIWNDIEDRPFGENWVIRSKEYELAASTSTRSVETPPLGYLESRKCYYHDGNVVNVYLNGVLYKSGTVRQNANGDYRIIDSNGEEICDGRGFKLDRTTGLRLGYVVIPSLTETTTILVTYEYMELKTLDEKFIPGNLIRSGTGTNAVVLNGGQPETASGTYSHAEGWEVVASGNYSHAEGYCTVASGSGGSHAEGARTIAAGRSQHAQGRYNIEDTEDKYAHIVGNGENKAPSNAHTLDWDGNAWFAGTIKMGGTGQDDLDAVEVASKTDLDALSVEDICTNIERVILYSGEMLFETPETVTPDRGWFEGTTITCSDTSIYPAESKVAIFFDGKRVIEDRSIFSKDFTIATFDYDVMFIPGESSFNIRVHAKDISSHTIGVYIWYPVFTPIDSKYLSDTIATKTYVDEAVANIDIPEQVNADWNENDPESPAYIQNRPFFVSAYSVGFDPAQDVASESEYIDMYMRYVGTYSVDEWTTSAESLVGSTIAGYNSAQIFGTNRTDIENENGVTCEQVVTYDDCVSVGTDSSYVMFDGAHKACIVFVSETDAGTTAFDLPSMAIGSTMPVTFPSAGMWVMKYASSVQITSIEFREYKTLDPKYLPDSVATITYVDEAVANIDIPEGFSGSWNDLTDKPFGINIEIDRVMAENVTVTFTDVDGDGRFYAYMNMIQGVTNNSIFPNEKYLVVWDGVEYLLTGKKGSRVETMGGAIGNLSLNQGKSSPVYGFAELTEDTGEPFAMLHENYEASQTVIFASTEGEHTFSIAKVSEIVSQIDEKYIPDTIARVKDIPKQVNADWSVNDETSPAYIKNKPTEEDALTLLMEMGMIEPTVDADGTILTDENGYVFSY